LPDAAGVYGKQEPLPFSSDLDKRDLFFTFRPERKVQAKDAFFDNANSIIKREIWEKFPFDEEALHIENLIWGKEIIERGYKIIYSPDASVYHYHGIHHGGDLKRAKEVVEILERIDPEKEKKAANVAKLKIQKF
jgi:rhamnosyltransferase